MSEHDMSEHVHASYRQGWCCYHSMFETSGN